MRGTIAKNGPNLESYIESDCPQFWDDLADIKHPRYGEDLSGVKASGSTEEGEIAGAGYEENPSRVRTNE